MTRRRTMCICKCMNTHWSSFRCHWSDLKGEIGARRWRRPPYQAGTLVPQDIIHLQTTHAETSSAQSRRGRGSDHREQAYAEDLPLPHPALGCIYYSLSFSIMAFVQPCQECFKVTPEKRKIRARDTNAEKINLILSSHSSILTTRND